MALWRPQTRLRRALLVLTLGLGIVGLGSWSLQRQAKAMLFETARENPFASFSQQLPALNWQTPLNSTAFQTYLDFYGLDFPDTQHHAGILQTVTGKTFVHIYRPQQVSKGTVLAMHGYFIHGAQLNHLTAALLTEGYTVVTPDLPGHGLSDGPRADIDNFSDYARLIEDLTPRLQARLPSPLYLMAHSTGGAGSWEYLLRNPDHTYQRVVLAAPLVRSWLWDLSLMGFYLGQGWLQELPRLLREDTSDPGLLEVIRRDPLQSAATPVNWVRALIDWNQNVIEAYPPSQTPLLILQGEADTVVDWQHNLPFLQRKFPRAQIEKWPEARHDLYWEAPALRTALIQRSLSFLAQPLPGY
ncbi:MAG: alpha/beta hydrolase [Candidatus Sericytochromatia bacterium]|nr:alpha/beta hydrolase [Candidatus Sericytochromatia bacterium]